MDKVRFGIVGIGNMGSVHATYLHEGKIEGACLGAVCDLKQSRLDWAKEKLGDDVARFTDYKEMLASGLVDCVIVAVPHYYHPPICMDVLKAGLHVISEKPIGVYTKQAEELIELAEKSGKVFGLMFNQRTNPMYRKARDMVQNGELGELKRCVWIITDWYRTQSYYDSGDWRATWSGEGGGVLLNQCPHNLDLWQWICGMPTKVRAHLHFGKWHDIEVEDDVTAYVEYANGATGVFVTTTGDTPGTNRFEIAMEKGKLVAEGSKLTMWKSDMTEAEFSAINKEPFGSMKFEETVVETDGESLQHVGVLNAFAGKILHGTPLIADGVEGINGLTISNAMHLSAWLDQTVSVDHFDHERFYEELMKHVATSRRKTSSAEAAVSDLNGTYGA